MSHLSSLENALSFLIPAKNQVFHLLASDKYILQIFIFKSSPSVPVVERNLNFSKLAFQRETKEDECRLQIKIRKLVIFLPLMN